MLVRIGNFEVLRRVAETASGFRYTPVYVKVQEGADPNGAYLISVSDAPPAEVADQDVVFQVDPVTYDHPPRVEAASIATAEREVDLMRVQVAKNEAQGFTQSTHAADAVFWSLSAVEKFVAPYYASVFGDRGAAMVQAVVDALKPKDAGEGAAAADGTSGTDDALAFAVAHLPSSEYVTDADGSPVPQIFTLHTDGMARHIVAGGPG